MLEYMVKDMDDEPLTIKDIHKVLIPAMREVFATRKDLEECVAKLERQLRGMLTDVLREHGILVPGQLEEIHELEV